MCIICRAYNKYTNIKDVINFLKNRSTLHCQDCSVLTTIPDIPGITFIICCNCPQLHSIAPIKSLTDLVIYECNSLKTIPQFQNMHELFCDNCLSIETIPNLRGLKKLHMNGCSSLKFIPEIDGLASAEIENCVSLVSFPYIQSLNILKCCGCIKLQSIPIMDDMYLLWCTKCPALTLVPDNVNQINDLKIDQYPKETDYVQADDISTNVVHASYGQCISCWNNQAVILSANCGHACLCHRCSEYISCNDDTRKCPVCRIEWTNLVRIYL